MRDDIGILRGVIDRNEKANTQASSDLSSKVMEMSQEVGLGRWWVAKGCLLGFGVLTLPVGA